MVLICSVPRSANDPWSCTTRPGFRLGSIAVRLVLIGFGMGRSAPHQIKWGRRLSELTPEPRVRKHLNGKVILLCGHYSTLWHMRTSCRAAHEFDFLPAVLLFDN